ncbi:Fubp1 [Symbiodinium natans]|uniref:Fubp1 protein n=1 Tax=Symbiodinium natans TaxID=878477 RepID=A0A812QAC2_9DINO|nr:Fubp1 [Symbiodinium natans]
MGPKQLLDAIDRASRAGVGLESNVSEVSAAQRTQLWERLSCRCQALMLCLSPQQLCRALFGFHRARCHDEELLHSACEALLSEEGAVYDEPQNPEDLEDEFGVQKLGTHAVLSANDVAMLLKALSRFHYTKHPEVLDFLLQRAAATLEEATTSDVAQLLGAAARLGLGEQLASEALLEQLFGRARLGLFDKFTPAADATNLCAAAALLPKTEQGAQLLAEIAGHLRKAEKAAGLAPRDLVRRLQSLTAFDRKAGDSNDEFMTVQQRLGREGREEVCIAAAEAPGSKCSLAVLAIPIWVGFVGREV